MAQCSGAVVLGYPQAVVARGSLKGKPISSELILPTEWNHIEASLAYARNLPLLIIHHSGIRRGVFDRGAISRFIYEIDLADPGWPLRQDIQGALTTWKANVLKGGGTLPVREAPTLQAQPAVTIGEDHLAILMILASGHHLSSAEIAHASGFNLQRAKHYIEVLLDARYVDRSMAVGRPTVYYLAKAGRALLVERNLV
jgi:hypothetical protein